MPFTDQDRERLAAIDERTKNLPCALREEQIHNHGERISRVEASGKTAAWALGLLMALLALAQGIMCAV
jgi:hypothetical protein